MFIRSHNNPILKPADNHPWESLKVYNPTAIYAKGEYHLFYRAAGADLVSSIGYGYSFDGENFIRYDLPLLQPSARIEEGGIEDPRLTQIDRTYYLTFTAYDGRCARLCLATSHDLKTWKRQGVMLPSWNAIKARSFAISQDNTKSYKIPDKDWSKSGGIFGQKINGNYWMLFGDSNIYLATSPNGLRWKAQSKPFFEPRKDYFDNMRLEMGPPPLMTEKGWLLIYHGIDKYSTYRLGYALLDKNNPSKVLFRSKYPIFYPETSYELVQIDAAPVAISPDEIDEKRLKAYTDELNRREVRPKVIFCCGAVIENDKIRLYYGAADSTIATAIADLDKLVS